MYHEAPKSKRIEFRSPDPAANPYLAFSALMMAGLDGIKRELDPGEPLDADIYELPPETLAKIATVPSSLEASLDALEADNAFLSEGDVFTPGLIEAYVRYKRDEEVDAIRMRPHPWEFARITTLKRFRGVLPFARREVFRASERCRSSASAGERE